MAEPGDSSSGVSADGRGTIAARTPPRSARRRVAARPVVVHRARARALRRGRAHRAGAPGHPHRPGWQRQDPPRHRGRPPGRQRHGLEAAFVDLAPVGDPGLIASSIAAALAIRPGPSQTVEDALRCRTSRERTLLLVLDNLEQLLPDAGPVLSGLAGACPGLRLLATSRAPLHVRGEQEYLVEPLVQAEAQALFRDRAREVDSGFELTDANRPAVEEICRRLDGLPLAIELAAARSKAMTPEALLRRLAAGGALPASVAVDAPARQRTLRDTIAWSFGLLSPVERTVFSRVCVFVGGFGADAAAEVARRSVRPRPDRRRPRPRQPGRSQPRPGGARPPGRAALRAARDRPRVRPRASSRLTSSTAFDGRHARYFKELLVARTDYGAAPFHGTHRR